MKKFKFFLPFPIFSIFQSIKQIFKMKKIFFFLAFCFGGENFISFMEKELMPFIESNYP